jgi:hypothetical protein
MKNFQDKSLKKKGKQTVCYHFITKLIKFGVLKDKS